MINLFSRQPEYFGLFETHSLMMRYSSTLSHLQGVLEKSKDTDGKVDLSRLCPTELREFLIYIHERDHFRQFISTPFGILVWRCYQLLIRKIFHAINHFKEKKIDIGGIKGRPLMDWWRETGQALYRPIREQEGDNLFEEHIINEIYAITLFVEILTSSSFPTRHPNVTIGSFIDMINELYPRLARWSGLGWNSVWTTELPRDQPLFGESTCGFNVPAMMEGMCMLTEHYVLCVGNSAESVPEWKKELYGDYKVGYEFGIENFCRNPEDPDQLSAAYVTYSICLSGNIDVAGSSFFERRLLVENEFPWFRCKTAAKPENAVKLQRSTVDIFNSILSKTELFSEYSTWDKVALPKNISRPDDVPEGAFNAFLAVFNHMAIHFRVVESRFFQGIKFAQDLHKDGKGPADHFAKLALFEEYADCFWFGSTFMRLPEQNTDDEENRIARLAPLIISYQQEFALNILYGLPCRTPMAIGEKYCASVIYPEGRRPESIEAEKWLFRGFFTLPFFSFLLPMEIAHFTE